MWHTQRQLMLKLAGDLMKLAYFFSLLFIVANPTYLVYSMEPDEDDYPSRYPLHFYVREGQEKEVKE